MNRGSHTCYNQEKKPQETTVKKRKKTPSSTKFSRNHKLVICVCFLQTSQMAWCPWLCSPRSQSRLNISSFCPVHKSWLAGEEAAEDSRVCKWMGWSPESTCGWQLPFPRWCDWMVSGYAWCAQWLAVLHFVCVAKSSFGFQRGKMKEAGLKKSVRKMPYCCQSSVCLEAENILQKQWFKKRAFRSKTWNMCHYDKRRCNLCR